MYSRAYSHSPASFSKIRGESREEDLMGQKPHPTLFWETPKLHKEGKNTCFRQSELVLNVFNRWSARVREIIYFSHKYVNCIF